MIESCIKLVKNTLRIQAYLSPDLEAAILEVAMPFVTYSLHYSGYITVKKVYILLLLLWRNFNTDPAWSRFIYSFRLKGIN